MVPRPSIPEPEGTLPRLTGGFRLLKELGRGGMGVVYRAEEIGSGRHVALKVLTPDLVVSDEALERFRREARFAAAISDTHCVYVYGAHEIEGAPAISMELCGAETLEDRIRSGQPIPIQTAVRWMIDILEGLEAAHRAGVLHRDVKPSNCFLTADGRVKIGDFGLARTLERDVRLTQSGAFLGSPLYASPEQVKGRDLDLRSDLYSCGATLFAMLTGQSPFGGTHMGEVLSKILSESPPKLRSIRPEVPRRLERIVLKAMQREPKRRYQEYAAFREALLPFVSEFDPAKPGWRVIAYLVDSIALVFVGLGSVVATAALGVDPLNVSPITNQLVASRMGSLVLAFAAFAYWTIGEGFFGASLGKWVMGQRVIAVASGHASLPRASVRALVFVAPSLLPLALAQFGAGFVGIFDPTAYAISVAATLALFVTARKRNGYRGAHELASGTRVAQTSSVFARFSRTATVPERKLARAEGAPAAIGSYQIEGALGETPLGLLFKGKDPELGRTVWMQACTRGVPELDEERRSLARAGRLRWLHTVRHEDARYEIYEDPGGSSFTELLPARRGFQWSRALGHLTSFAEELAEFSKSPAAPSPTAAQEYRCIEQVWVDRTGNLRLLDVPIGAGPFASLSSIELLAEVTRKLLLGAGSTARSREVGTEAGATVGTAERDLPPDLPMNAEATVRRILGLDEPYARVDDARRALADLAGRQRPLTRRMRATQIVASTIPSVLVPILFAIAWTLLAAPSQDAQDARKFERLVREQVDSPADTDDHQQREILIAYLGRQDGGVLAAEHFSEAERALVEAAKKANPRAGESAAGEASRKLLASAAARGETREDYMAESGFGVARARGSLLGFIALAILTAFAFRGGPLLAAFGIAIRDRRGDRATRVRCAVRAAVVWAPWIAFFAVMALPWTPSGYFPLFCLLAVAITYAIGIAWSVWNPPRGPQDLLAGTRLVPR